MTDEEKVSSVDELNKTASGKRSMGLNEPIPLHPRWVDQTSHVPTKYLVGGAFFGGVLTGMLFKALLEKKAEKVILA